MKIKKEFCAVPWSCSCSELDGIHLNRKRFYGTRKINKGILSEPRGNASGVIERSSISQKITFWDKIRTIMNQNIVPKRSLFFLGVEISLVALRTILLFGLVAILMRIFVVQPYIVIGQSMEPSFSNKEYLLIDKLSYRFRNPKRGEVIILHPPHEPKESYIKRIIGLSGETVEIEGEIVKINGRILQESYVKRTNSTQSPQTLKITLKQSEYFVMGDNRHESSDSREFGPIPRVNFVGRSAIAVLPLAKFGFIPPVEYAF